MPGEVWHEVGRWCHRPPDWVLGLIGCSLAGERRQLLQHCVTPTRSSLFLRSRFRDEVNNDMDSIHAVGIIISKSPMFVAFYLTYMTGSRGSRAGESSSSLLRRLVYTIQAAASSSQLDRGIQNYQKHLISPR